MTNFIPLDAATQCPISPAFLVPSQEPAAQLVKVIKAVMKAKRIVVVCGAGISVKAGIPDFRSPEGLFQSLKRENPRESLSSGKDLFDASVFNSEHTTSLFCQMIARLSELSEAAQPTPFHQLLRQLDNRGKLLRVYTQNIDAIEAKAGLSFGIPGFASKSRSKAKACPGPHHPRESAQASTSRLPSPPAETPRCIPLHGTLQTLHCQTCTHIFPMADYVSSLTSGVPPHCPECIAMERTRQLVGKRARGIGKLRPSVVLYNEAHKDGEGVGEAVGKDLMGSSKGKGRSGADLLLVVGTSLRVPGTKRMVREFAKAVRLRGTPSTKEAPSTPSATSSTSSPRRSPVGDDEPPIKAIYLNLDFPVPTREWEGVFDAWIQGDAQTFAAMLQQEIQKELEAKELAIERKRRREEEAAALALQELQLGTDTEEDVDLPIPEFKQGQAAKRKRPTSPKPSTPTKRRIIAFHSAERPDSDRPITSFFPPAIPDARLERVPSSIILRIPPLRRQTPPNFIPTPRPSTGSGFLSKKQQSALFCPPTPPRSPPRPLSRKKNGSIKTSVPALRLVTAPPADSLPLPISPLPSPDPSPASAEPPELNVSLVRNIQYGLRGPRPDT